MCIECRRVLFPLSTFHVGMHIDHTIISTNSSNFICFAWPDFDRSLSAFPRFANLFWRTNERAPLPLSRLAFPLIRTRRPTVAAAAALHWRHTTEPVGWPPGSRGSWLWRIQFERWNFSNTHRPTHLPTYRAARGYQFRCRRTGLLTRFEWVLDAWSKGKYSPEIQFRRMEIVFRQHFSSRSRARWLLSAQSQHHYRQRLMFLRLVIWQRWFGPPFVFRCTCVTHVEIVEFIFGCLICMCQIGTSSPCVQENQIGSQSPCEGGSHLVYIYVFYISLEVTEKKLCRIF